MMGRDILSRIIHGARISLTVGFIAVGIATALGILMGVIAGYYGGWIDNVLMRITDILFAFPSLLLAIVIVAVIGQGLDKAMIAIGIEYSPQMARVMRGSVLYIKEMEYVEAQKAIGSSNRRIILRHVLPNSLSPVIVYGTLMMAGAILDAAALGFLGLGAQPPSPEWGQRPGLGFRNRVRFDSRRLRLRSLRPLQSRLRRQIRGRRSRTRKRHRSCRSTQRSSCCRRLSWRMGIRPSHLID